MIGQTISHYKITAKLGEGGMGEVYLATDTTLDRQVALKFLPESLQKDPEARERLIREAKAASRLQHPNILTIHAVEHHDGRDFIVMEYVRGVALSSLGYNEDLGVSEILDVVIQIADGLHAAHEAGIVHRDIKPDNILVTPYHQVKIMDFGLAFQKGAPTVTKAGAVLGTAYYMSPEQAEGRRVDHRSDIFALGVVLYELLCRHRPFEGESEVAVLYSIISEPPHPLVRYCAGAPDELQRIVNCCLAKSPSERYQSAAHLLADLKCVKDGNAAVMTRTPRRTMIAVLPFQNLGAPDDEYFADGITEEITSRLSSIGRLGVISRTSARQYKATKKSIREIGAELGVDYILEGSVQWGRLPAGPSRIRITPQLIHVTDDTHVWSESYDRLIDDIFAIQTDIAGQVSEQLRVSLTTPERKSVEQRPTENMEAYHAYLRGIEYAERVDYSHDDLKLALRMFARAVALDPAFALAHARAAIVYAGIYNSGYKIASDILSLAKDAADRALMLQPQLAWGHLARCYYHYWGLKDFEEALRELSLAEVGRPNDPAILMARAYIWRRQGRLRAALEPMKRAFELDPRDARIPSRIAETYQLLRDYPQAVAYYDQSISLAPDQIGAYLFKAQVLTGWKGDMGLARAVLAAIPRQDAADTMLWTFWGYIWERDYAAALNSLSPMDPDETIYPVTYERKIQLEGLTHRLMGNPERARSCYESARIVLERESGQRPNDYRVRGSLGMVYAALGRKTDALREGSLGLALCPLSRDAMVGPHAIEVMALICTMVEEFEAAIDHLEQLLSIPSLWTARHLQLDPRFDSLRSHPRFQKLLEQPDKVF